uniref:Uncharacterized protein n=1 Tax=Populus alba TaxID=43335 RepID=A0A4U5QH39_POPAL|nr:hypothetical protein D5086_0000092940 [Populus alba]
MEEEMAATPDHLFRLRNNFYLGANQAAINTSDLPNLSQDDSKERLPCLSFLHCPWQLPAIANNSILRLIAGIMLLHGEDYSEALKHTNAGGTVEL